MKTMVFSLLFAVISTACLGQTAPSPTEALLCLRIDAPTGQTLNGMSYPQFIIVRHDGAFMAGEADAKPAPKDLEKCQVEVVSTVSKASGGYPEAPKVTTFVLKQTEKGANRDSMVTEYRIPCTKDMSTGLLTFSDTATYTWCGRNPDTRFMTTVTDYSPLVAGLKFKVTVLKNNLVVKKE